MVGIARCHTAGRSGSVGKSFRPALAAAGQGHGSWRYLADNRLLLEAVFCRVRTGAPWRDLQGAQQEGLSLQREHRQITPGLLLEITTPYINFISGRMWA
ncbi:MAG: transposase [Synechococcus sp. SB0673_bin_10]|nr:transposase [Synechococcus sp. SB0675_bin_7]MYI71380.1 transposase [Synechococcus sp. SB0673_bin_10]MYK84963.1 transposase [Synechococcus sp. SB0669_bin_7]